MTVYSRLKERLTLWKIRRNPLNNKCISLKKLLMIRLTEEMKTRNCWMLENKNAKRKLLIMVSQEEKRKYFI